MIWMGTVEVGLLQRQKWYLWRLKTWEIQWCNCSGLLHKQSIWKLMLVAIDTPAPRLLISTSILSQFSFTLGFSLAIWNNSPAWTTSSSNGISWKIGQLLSGQYSSSSSLSSLLNSPSCRVTTAKQALLETTLFGVYSYSLTSIFAPEIATKFTFITIL